MVPLSEQFSSFFITISTGIIMGIIYDIYWLIRERLHFRQFGTGIGDLLFWSITTGVAFFLLLIGNWGEVRFYVFIGILLGLVLYLRIFSKVVRKMLWLSMLAVTKFFTVTLTLGLWPFRVFRKIILVPIGYLGLWKGWQSKKLRNGWGKMRSMLIRIKRRIFKIK